MTNAVAKRSRESRPPVDLSVVVPCYEEEACIDAMYERLSRVCAQVTDSYELVLIDDGSQDATWSMLAALAERDPHVVAIKLSRNHGHQLALTCGLESCVGERILVIDADLQDPPELLTDMMRLMDEGADVVYGRRRTRAGETPFKKTSARVFYRFLSSMSEVEIPLDVGDFRLMSRRTLDVLNAMPERHRFVRGMVAWIGFRQVAIEYDRDARLAGVTKYPFRRMVSFGLNAIASFSIRPLLMAGTMSGITALFGVAVLLYAGIGYATGKVVSGWTSLMGFVAILASVQLAFLGVIGFYVGRLYEETKGRPLYVVETVRAQSSRSEGVRAGRASG